MNVLRHDHIPDKLEAVPRADMVENLHEAMAGPRCAEQGSATITAESDEVEIAASVKALQTVAHEKSRPSKVKDRTLETHKGAAPTLTSTTYKESCANDILDARFGESKLVAMSLPPAHVWADLLGGESTGTQGNMREALVAEDRVRNTDPSRGLKIRHQDSPQLIKATDLPRITNPGSQP